MSKNFFVSPPKDKLDFKELFQDMAALGAGMPIGSHGFPEGHWTPELLSQAISSLPDNTEGIELRTVQLWFQDNDRGISAQNIRWLAQIFGCGDQAATSEWQATLSHANRRLSEKRKNAKRQKDINPTNEVSSLVQPDQTHKLASIEKFNLAIATERILTGSALSLPAMVFAGAVILGFVSYFLRIHDVNVEVEPGFIKQVGFLWAPNWTVLFLVFMPIFFLSISELLNFWRSKEKDQFWPNRTNNESSVSWTKDIQSAKYTCWAILLICLLFAGLFQWVSIRLQPLLDGNEEIANDWGTIAIIRPDIISVESAIAFTGAAYLYMAVTFYFFFASLALLYLVTMDVRKNKFAETLGLSDQKPNEGQSLSTVVYRHIFRCSVLAVCVALCMKLQSTYLASNGTNVLSWLTSDALALFKITEKGFTIGEYIAPSQFSSLLIVLVSSFLVAFSSATMVGEKRLALSTYVLLLATYFLMGRVVGFSILLFLACSGTALALYTPSAKRPGTTVHG